MTSREAHQELNRLEKHIKGLEQKQPSLQKLAMQTRERLEHLERQDTGNYEAILEARLRASMASQMVTDNQAAIKAAHEDIERLTLELDTAKKAEAYEAAQAAHEQALAAWRKQAGQSVKAFKAELEKLSVCVQHAGSTARAVKEAAEATGVNYNAPNPPPLPEVQINWLDVPGVENISSGGGYALPGITTEYMQLSPPTMRTKH